MYIYIIITLLIGAAVGSFLNVIIYRADELKSVIRSRSKCRSCNNVLKWYDLIPILSFILLRGKCRNCKERISMQYPIVEGSTALLFLIIFLNYGISWQSVFYALIFSLFVVIFVHDLRTQLIADIFSWPVLAFSLALGWYFAGASATDLVYGLLTGAGVLILLVIISREEWMGMGDVIIGAAFGALLCYPRSVLFLFLSFVIGSLAGLVLIAFKKKGIKDAVPFAPFMIIAGFISLIWGNQIVDWYLGAMFMY